MVLAGKIPSDFVGNTDNCLIGIMGIWDESARAGSIFWLNSHTEKARVLKIVQCYTAINNFLYMLTNHFYMGI